MRHLRWWTGSERVDMGLGSPKVGLNEPFDWAQCRWVEALRQAQGERREVRGTLGATQGERWRVLRSVVTTQTVRAEPFDCAQGTFAQALRQAQGERWRVLRSVATSQTVRAEPVEAPPQTPLERVQFFRAVTS